MRSFSLAAAIIGVVVIVWEFRFVGSKGSLWLEFMLIAVAIILIAVEQIRHGGS